MVHSRENPDIRPFTGKIALLGAGAMGGYYGACLFRAGFDVHFLMRRDYEAVRERGLAVRSVRGDFHIEPPVYEMPEAIGPADLVLVGLKATDNAALPGLLAPLLGPATRVLTLQNGLGNEEAVAAALADLAPGGDPARRVLGGIAFICSHRGEPGVIHHTQHGWIKLAEMAGPPTAATRSIAEMFRRAGIDCRLEADLRRMRWSKLVWNVPFNGLGVAAGHADTAAILADAELRELAERLMDEVMAAAEADGAPLDPALPADMMGQTPSMGAYRTSMQLDYEAGRPMEVEAIFGEPLRRARAAGLEAPRLAMLHALLRRLDAENRPAQIFH